METTIYPNKLRSSADVLDSVSGKVKSSAGIVEQAADSLSKEMDAYDAISDKLRKYSSELSAVSKNVAKFGSAATAIATLYENADKPGKVTKVKPAEGAKPGAKKAAGGKQAKDSDELWSYKSGAVSGGAGITSGTLSGGLFVVKGSVKGKAKWDPEGGTAGINGEIGGQFSVAHGKAEGNIGMLGGEIEADVGKVGAKGEFGIGLMKEGRFDPSVKAKASAEAVGAEGKVSAHFGNDKHDVHAEATGKLGYAGAEAGVELGKNGFKAEAGAEAYAATGEVKGGFKIFGVKVNGAIEGKAGGAGVGSMAEVGNTKASGYIGAGLGLGVGLKLEVDWSGFKI